jgi:LysM domain
MGMNSTARRPAWTAGVLLPTCLVAAWVLVETTGPLRHPADPGFANLLTAFAAWLLVGCAGWSTLVSAAALVETTTAGRVRATTWVGCPPSLRRVLVAGIGFALVSGVSGQTSVVARVTASVTASERGTSPGRSAPSWQRSLPVPARPLGRVPSSRSPRVLVRPGDTLWHLAADRLRPSASDGEVALLVERIHRRNQELIGPDPDLIHPGQRLVVPDLGQHP